MVRRRSVVVVAVTLALGLVPALIAHQSRAGHYVAAPPVCGTARWEVKTLADAAAADIESTRTEATVLGLTTLPAPPHVGNALPRQAGFGGVEFTTYRVRVRLVGWKLSDNDSDIHLEVRGLHAPQTMVVEFPLVGCVATSASLTNRRRIARAKTALLKACGKTHAPSTSMRALTGTATITGVGFFDKTHGQTGGAANGIELHPVVGFSSTNCRTGALM
jgi:hypothetical protein